MPAAASVATSGIAKTLEADLLRAFTAYEKVEGLTRTRDGDWWVVLDNDGGEFESRLLRFRDSPSSILSLQFDPLMEPSDDQIAD